MTNKDVQFVVCRSLPEVLRISRAQIDGLGTEFSLCDCYYCGQSLVIGLDEATNASTLDLHIVCPKCAIPYQSVVPRTCGPN